MPPLCYNERMEDCRSKSLAIGDEVVISTYTGMKLGEIVSVKPKTVQVLTECGEVRTVTSDKVIKI